MKRFLSLLLCLSLVSNGLWVTAASAAMVATPAALAGRADRSEIGNAESAAREQAFAFLQTAKAQQAMQQLGISPALAAQRVRAMTPAELSDFNAQLQQLPSGQGGLFPIIAVIAFLAALVIGWVIYQDHTAPQN